MKLFKVLLVFFLLIIAGCLDMNDTQDADTAAVMDEDISIDGWDADIYSDTCADDLDIGLRSDTAGDSEMDVLPSSGCGTIAPVKGKKIIFVKGRLRTYFLDVPADYDKNHPYPLVFAFHGLGFSGKNFRLYSGFSENLNNDAIVVYPDAVGDRPAWELNGNKDLLFFDAMLDKLSDQLCIDQTRVFATGHSKGATFTNVLGCHRGDIIRAIAPVAGRASNSTDQDSCTGEVAVLIAHGEKDWIVPFKLGVQARNNWIAANGCSTDAISIEPDSCVEYDGCDDEYPVQWCAHSKGHRWPDFAAEAISDFFRSF